MKHFEAPECGCCLAPDLRAWLALLPRVFCAVAIMLFVVTPGLGCDNTKEQTISAKSSSSSEATTSEWIRYQSPDGVYAVELPAQPKVHTSPLGGDGEGELHSGHLTDGNLELILTHADMGPDWEDETLPAADLDVLLEGVQDLPTMRETSRRKLEVDGAPALRVEYRIGTSRTRHAVVAATPRYMFTMMATHPIGKRRNDALRFIESFEIADE